MSVKQQIYLVRRQYNQWVNNQTLEDYALRFTAKAARRWSLASVANTALGAITFLVLEAIGAAITIHYGFDNAVAAILVVSLLIFLAGLPICYYAAKYGVDIDLLTRGAGFGYIGSTATSLIYASFTFIFFALEAAIMAKALELILGLPLAYGYIASSIIIIPLVFFGITFISRFQVWTQPFWIFLQLLPLVFILFKDASLLKDWQAYQGTDQTTPGINLLLFGAAASVMFALVAQIGEQVDFLRFLPEKNKDNSIRWWTALIAAGPGWVIIGAIKMLIGSFLAVLAIKYHFSLEFASDPTTMYAIAFGFVTDNQHLALILAGIFVVISQVKINVTNAYAGSIAWSNFFSRLTHNHPGRVVWLVFNVAIALLLMELGIYRAFESTLSIYAIVAVSWVGALVADLTINKPLGLSPKHIEFRRAYLFDINPVGVGSVVIASTVGLISYLGFWGVHAQALAHFVTLSCALFTAPLIAILTRGRYYIARPPYEFSDKEKVIVCLVCENTYENEDMAICPAYEGFICSLCCSLDARCNDSCKPNLSIGEKIIRFIQKSLPTSFAEYINLRLLQFISLLSLCATFTGILLALIYTNTQVESLVTNALLAATLWKIFFILMIGAGIICWLFVLAHQSQSVAQEESRNQTYRLVAEIEAHKKTDQQLQRAKDQADEANNAKSRYLTGITHELRSPLNTVLGYAQLLQLDDSIDAPVLEKIQVIQRSSEHLADLIEGLLEISKIEAGRLDIQRKPIRFRALLDQIDLMFRLQAEDKNLSFTFERLSAIPDAVMGDEKRIRQILINLLSNAIKYSETGSVKFSVKYRNQVAEFRIEDTGIGIHKDEFDRIFRPFERVRRPGGPSIQGTGLGLTITRLLAELMGGDITVESVIEKGSTFTVFLMLSSIEMAPYEEIKSKKIYGYTGPKKSILVVDDDASHRGIISDLLTPLKFGVVEAHDAESCLDMIKDFTPDMFIIDRQMPGMNGPQLAKKLRQNGLQTPIVMVTANANEDTYDENTSSTLINAGEHPTAYNEYLTKPVRIDSLLSVCAKYLSLEWIYTSTSAHSFLGVTYKNIDKTLCKKIIFWAQTGQLTQLKNTAETFQKDKDIDPKFSSLFMQHAKDIRFDKIIELLQAHK